MITLIKNEYYKIFHKKSTYITLIIIFMIVFLTNIIYKKMDNFNNTLYVSKNYINEIETNIKNFSFETGNMYEYANLLAELDNEKYIKAQKERWIQEKYEQYVSDKVNNYYQELYGNKDKQKAKELQQEIDNLKLKLSKSDWRYFVQLQIDEIKANIDSMKSTIDVNSLSNNIVYNANLYILKLNTVRLKENIGYNHYLNKNINTLENTIYDKISYETTKNKDTKKRLQDNYKLFKENEYILEHKLDTSNNASLREIVIKFFDEYTILILIFIIMISGSIMSEEFNKGTIKSLLTTPYTRSKIFFAKLLTTLSMIPLITLIILLFEFIVGGIMFGFASIKTPIILYDIQKSQINRMPVLCYFLKYFISILPLFILLNTLAFSLSTIINNTAFSIVIAFLGYMSSNIINLYAKFKNLKFLKYFVTTNWDLSYLVLGNKSPYGISAKVSIIICLIYFILMVAISLYVFKRKNIKNI